MTIEAEFAARIAAMSPKERVARSAALFQWSREMIGRQIRAERLSNGVGPLSPEQLKWRIALRMYGSDPASAAVIQRRLPDVSS